MKFSFESQQYRDETAKELKETEKSERKEALEKKRRELKFVLSEHIRDFNRKNDKNRKEDYIEKLKTQDSNVESKVVVDIRDYSEDESTNERVEVETIDISDQIPESVQIIYDMNRLLEVEYTYKDDEVSRGWRNNDDTPENRKYKEYITRDPHYHLDSIDLIIEKYIKMAEKEKGEPLTTDDGTIIHSEELKKIAEQAKKDFVEFREKMTEGLASNPSVLYHTVGAHTGGFSSDWYRSTMLDENDVKKKLRNRFPNNSDGFEIKETPLEINEDLESYGLWVNAGKIAFNGVLKPLMLMDMKSPRFKKYIYRLITRDNPSGYYDSSEYGNSFEEVLKDRDAADVWGVKLQGRTSDPIQWLQIADQIFDPYHGRMIKIREVDAVDGKPDPQS